MLLNSRIEFLLLAAALLLRADTVACGDSKYLPRMEGCRIDNCESKEFDRRELPIGWSSKGEPVSRQVVGELHAYMYECNESVTPAAIGKFADVHLRNSGWRVPYSSLENEADVSAQKGDEWILVEAVSRYYTVRVIRMDAGEAPEPLNAKELQEEIDANGHVAVYGVRFALGGKPAVLPSSDEVLGEVVKLLKDHSWSVRVEAHTDNTGSTAGNLIMARQQAAAVVAWLIAHGIDKDRLTPVGVGDAKPIADTESSTGRAQNRRIEIVKN